MATPLEQLYRGMNDANLEMTCRVLQSDARQTRDPEHAEFCRVRLTIIRAELQRRGLGGRAADLPLLDGGEGQA